MRRRFFGFALLYAVSSVALPSSAASAQSVDSVLTRILDTAIRKNRTIRVSTTDSVFAGRATSLTTDELRLVGARIPTSHIRKVEVRGTPDRHGTHRGMLWLGIPIGLFIAGLAAAGFGMSEQPVSNSTIAAGALGIVVIGGGLGLLIGGLVGSIFNHDQAVWRQEWPAPSAAEIRVMTSLPDQHPHATAAAAPPSQ